MPPSRHALPAGRHKTGTAVRRTLQCGGRPFFSVSKNDTLQGEPISARIRGTEIPSPLVSPWGQNLTLNRALAARRLAHSQRQISLYVSRPYAHVVRSGLF